MHMQSVNLIFLYFKPLIFNTHTSFFLFFNSKGLNGMLYAEVTDSFSNITVFFNSNVTIENI